jgi:tetratricopeptide (TPR) repeat protein
MKKYLLHVLIISFVLFLSPAIQAASDVEEAIEVLKQRARENPDDAGAHNILGYAYFKEGMYKKAIEAFKRAIRINPDYRVAHDNLGNTYSKLGMDEEAIEAYKQAIRIIPDYINAHNNLGDAYYKLGMYKEAIGAFKQATRIKPDYADAHYNLGVVYGKSGMHKEAIEAYKQAIRINPDYINTRGLPYGCSGLRETTIASLKQAIRIDPDYAEAYCNIGKYYYHNIKDYKKAFDNLNKATELYIFINYDRASDNIAETSSLLDMLDDRDIDPMAKRTYEIKLRFLEDRLAREKTILR